MTTFDFLRINPSNEQLSDSQIISSSKQFSTIRRKADKEIKSNKCYICKKECTSFCNSHSIPTLVLKSIAKEGKVFRSVKICDSLSPYAELGVAQAGTFRIICGNCDNTVFQDYESDESIEHCLDGVFLSEIALKNGLHELYKKHASSHMFNAMSSFSPMAGSQVHPLEIDTKEAEICVSYALKAIGDKKNGYYLFYKEVLNYTVPIAFQGKIVLISDLYGNIVNDVYNFSEEYSRENLHICIFPLKDKTVVLMFVKEGDRRYRGFRRQFKKLDNDQKLELINYLVFLYSDEVFISPCVDIDAFNDNNLKSVCSLTSSYIIHSTSPLINTSPISQAKKAFDLSKRNSIPNFLSPKYALE